MTLLTIKRHFENEKMQTLESHPRNLVPFLGYSRRSSANEINPTFCSHVGSPHMRKRTSSDTFFTNRVFFAIFFLPTLLSYWFPIKRDTYWERQWPKYYTGFLTEQEYLSCWLWSSFRFTRICWNMALI